MQTDDAFSDENVKLRLARVMHTYVGDGKYITYAELEKKTGVKKTTLYSYTQSRSQMPGLAAALRILRALPPGAEKLLREDVEHLLPDDPTHFVQTATRHIAELTLANAEALEDGQIVRKERMKIASVARRAAPFVLGLIALAAAQ